MNATDWLGFAGVFQILAAYFLNVTGRLKTTSLIFIVLNLVGALMACLASMLIAYWPFVLLEGIWAVVSSFSLIRHLRSR
jgi:hypothetical protein